MEKEVYERIVPDTSILIEGFLSEKLENSTLMEEIIIHKAVLSELEHQANQGRSIGYLGLDEIKKIIKPTIIYQTLLWIKAQFSLFLLLLMNYIQNHNLWSCNPL